MGGLGDVDDDHDDDDHDHNWSHFHIHFRMAWDGINIMGHEGGEGVLVGDHGHHDAVDVKSLISICRIDNETLEDSALGASEGDSASGGDWEQQNFGSRTTEERSDGLLDR